VDVTGTPGAVPHIDASDPSLPPLLAAARIARAVRFDYRKSGSGTAEVRTIEPWRVLSWRRRWYVVGHDRDRGEARSFRLSRITSVVEPIGRAGSYSRPADLDLLSHVNQRPPEEGTIARIRVTGATAGQLRRMASEERDGVLTLTYTDPGWLARVVASAGVGVQVLEPAELIDAVVERLRAVAR
jgi:proteasome accessory factor B